MDLDGPESSPANGTPLTSLNITRTLNANLPSTSTVTDVISSFRPTKVPKRPFIVLEDNKRQQGLPSPPTKTSPAKTYITATSVLPHTAKKSSPLKNDHTATSLKTAPLIDPPFVPATPQTSGEENQVIVVSNTEQLFKRDDTKDGRPQPYILSLDYDDPGELLMTSESDDTIQIYKVREGRHDKQLLSKKYGVKLAKFTHTSSSVVYASTKVNGRVGWHITALSASLTGRQTRYGI